MGDYCNLQREIKFFENHKQDFVEKLIEIKYVARIPVFWIRQSKYTKTYYIFNKIPIFSVTIY